MQTVKARNLLIGLGGLGLVSAGAVYGYAQSQKPLLDLGVGYAARVACGCRYISGRSLSDCYKDFEPGMEPISLSDDPVTKTVTASALLIASRSVRFDAVLGCQPEAYAAG